MNDLELNQENYDYFVKPESDLSRRELSLVKVEFVTCHCLK